MPMCGLATKSGGRGRLASGNDSATKQSESRMPSVFPPAASETMAPMSGSRNGRPTRQVNLTLDAALRLSLQTRNFDTHSVKARTGVPSHEKEDPQQLDD